MSVQVQVRPHLLLGCLQAVGVFNVIIHAVLSNRHSLLGSGHLNYRLFLFPTRGSLFLLPKLDIDLRAAYLLELLLLDALSGRDVGLVLQSVHNFVRVLEITFLGFKDESGIGAPG